MELTGLISIALAGGILIYFRKKNITQQELNKIDGFGHPGSVIAAMTVIMMFLYMLCKLE